jgi:cytochrome c
MRSGFFRASLSVICVASLAMAFGAWAQSRTVSQLTKIAPKTTPVQALIGNAIRGQTLYQTCTGCHSLDENDVGPRHRGVVGRRAGSVPNYSYSPALKRSAITWDRVTLNTWLSGPQAMVPGSKMFNTVRSAQDRADIIAYLTQAK